MGRWFTAERVAALRPGIEAVADKLVDDMVSHGHPADLRAQPALPLPLWVICDVLGVPAADHDRFSYWSDVLLNLTRYGQDEIEQAQDDFVGTVEEALRFDADPGIRVPRYLDEPAEIAGHLLPPGTTVLCNTAAANRDGTVFAAFLRRRTARLPRPGVGARGAVGRPRSAVA